MGKKLTREESHHQCMREVIGTLCVAVLCCIWHIGSAWMLNGSGRYFLGVPAWFSVSVLGTVIILLAGVGYLMRHIFIDFDYDSEENPDEETP